MATRRTWWKAYQGTLDPSRLVFLDETWIKTNMAPIRGWCQKGQRLRSYAPHGHWKTMTFLAALRHDGVEAPCIFDGPINGERFLAWVKQMLCPSLKQGTLSLWITSVPTKAPQYERRSEQWERLLFLPSYSPDLNPIEQTFSKIKHWMRMAQERSVDAVNKTPADIIDTITPAECRNYFKNTGYDHSLT